MDSNAVPDPSGSEQPPAPDSPSAPDRYRERLWVPWWWWVVAAVLTGVVGYEIQLSAHGAAWSVVAYLVVAAICVSIILARSMETVVVTGRAELRAGRGLLPREVIDRGASVPPSAKSAAMGRQLDPAAFLVHRAWIPSMVLLVLDDPDDPTPYWLVSTRHPDRVLAALDIPDAARAVEQHTAEHHPDGAGPADGSPTDDKGPGPSQ